MINRLSHIKKLAIVIATILILTQLSINVVAEEAKAKFAITKTVTATSAKIGEEFEYTIACSCSAVGGESVQVTDVKITDTLPDYLEITLNPQELAKITNAEGNIEYSPNNGNPINAGDTIPPLTIPVRFKPNTPVGYTAENTAVISGDADGVAISATSNTVTTIAEASEKSWKLEKTATSGTDPIDPAISGAQVQVWYEVIVTGNENHGMTLYNVRIEDSLPPNYYMTSYQVEGQAEVVVDEPEKSGVIGATDDDRIVFDELGPNEQRRVYIKGYYQDGVGQGDIETNTATAKADYKKYTEDGDEYLFYDEQNASVDVTFAPETYGGNLIKYNRNSTYGQFVNQNYDRYEIGDEAYFRINASDKSNIGTSLFAIKDILPPKEDTGYPFKPTKVTVEEVTSMIGIPTDKEIKATVSVYDENDLLTEVGTVVANDGSEDVVDITTENLKEVIVEYYYDDGSKLPIKMSTNIVVYGEIGISGEDNTLYENKATLQGYDAGEEKYTSGPAVALFKIEKGKAWLSIEKEGDKFVKPEEYAEYKVTYSNNKYGGKNAIIKDIVFYDYINAVDKNGAIIDISNRDIALKDGKLDITTSAVIIKDDDSQEPVVLEEPVVANVDSGYRVAMEYKGDKVLETGQSLEITIRIKIHEDAKYGYINDKVFVKPMEDESDYDIINSEDIPGAGDLPGSGLPTTGQYLFAKESTFVEFSGIVKGRKYVHGDLDMPSGSYTEDGPANTDASATAADGYWKAGDATSNVVEGGTADYKLVVSNDDCNGPISDFIVIDNLPRVGDKNVISGGTRNSEWQPVLINKIIEVSKTNESGVTNLIPASDYHVYYSTKENPNKMALYASDFTIDGSGSYGPYSMHGGAFNPSYDWNANLPADLTKVKWMMVKYDGDTLKEQEHLTISWKMKAPVGTQPGKKAVNSFAYGGTYSKAKPDDPGAKGGLLPAEPVAVRHTVVDNTSSAKIIIGDRVWEDTNKNGLQDTDEQGINGLLVLLYDSSDNLVDYTRTSNDINGKPGYYKFTEVEKGDYTVKFGVPNSSEDGFSDYQATIKDANGNSSESSDSDADIASTPFTFGGQGDGREYKLFTTGQKTYNENNADIDFGLYRKTSISGLTWDDSNRNGVRDASEPVIVGVTVELLNAVTGEVKGTTTTGSDGKYSFDNLDPGSYLVRFTNSDYSYIPTADTGSDQTKNSDIKLNGTEGDTTENGHLYDMAAGTRVNLTDVIVLTSNEPKENIDAGCSKPKIGNQIFSDQDGNGIKDAIDKGVSGIHVLLAKHSESDNPDEVEFVSGEKYVTGIDGKYSFEGLDLDDYDVWFFVPEKDRYLLTNYVGGEDDNTSKITSLSATSIDEIADYDGSTSYNFGGGSDKYFYGKANVILSADEGEEGIEEKDFVNNTIDMGLIETCEISGKVFLDDDYDNNSSGDSLLNGGKAVLLKLDTESGGYNSIDEQDITDGTYSFTYLPPGNYKIGFERDNMDYGPVAKDAGDDTLDSDINTVPIFEALFLTDPMVQEYGERKSNVDGGFRKARIGNHVYLDANCNGEYDASEEQIAGATLKLYRKEDDDNYTELKSVASTLNSDYFFDDLDEGMYKVVLEMPKSRDFILSNVSTTVASKDEAGDDKNYVVEVFENDTHDIYTWSYKMLSDDNAFELKAGEDFKAVDFGFVAHGLIGGKVLDDKNNNGIQDEGEEGIGDLSVTLNKPNGTTETTTTNEDGTYGFGNLIDNGDYSVTFGKPDKHILSPSNVGSDDNVDSDATEEGDHVVIKKITLSSGDKEKKNNDAGFFSGLQLKGQVFLDGNKDGVFEGEEVFDEPVTIELLFEDGSQAKGMFDDPILPVQSVDGIYHFKGLKNDKSIQYKLRIVVPSGYKLTEFKRGTDTTKDSDFQVDTEFTEAFDLSILTDGYIKEHIDAGLIRNGGGDIIVGGGDDDDPEDPEDPDGTGGGDVPEDPDGTGGGDVPDDTTSGPTDDTPGDDTDTVVVTPGEETVITVIGQGGDPDGTGGGNPPEGVKKIEIISQPEGEVVITDEGEVKFTPNENFSGRGKIVLRVTYEDGTEEIIEIDIVDEDIAKGLDKLPVTGGMPLSLYLVMGVMLLGIGILFTNKSGEEDNNM